MSFSRLTLLALLLAFTSTATALGTKLQITGGAKFFVAQMEGDLDGFVKAQMLKQKLPIVVVTDEAQADYIMSGGAVKGIHRWYDTVMTGVERDRNQGNI